MKKPWYKSLTFWGALGFGVATFLQEMSTSFPVLLGLAQGLTGLMAAFGLRRAMN